MKIVPISVSLSIVIACIACTTVAEDSLSNSEGQKTAKIIKPEFVPLKEWQDKYWYKSSPPNFRKAEPQAQYRDNGKIEFLTFHHVGSTPLDTTEKEEIKTLGNSVWMNHARDNTYQDVAYHYLIGQSGRIYKGRPDNIAPASGTYYYNLSKPKYTANGRLDYSELVGGEKPGNNQGHLTISFLVGKDSPTDEAYDSAVNLAAFLMKEHSLSADQIRVHSEVANSTCPGDVIHRWIRGSLNTKGHKQEGEGVQRIKSLIKNG